MMIYVCIKNARFDEVAGYSSSVRILAFYRFLFNFIAFLV